MSKAITLQEFIMDTQTEFPFLSGQLNRLEERRRKMPGIF